MVVLKTWIKKARKHRNKDPVNDEKHKNLGNGMVNRWFIEETLGSVWKGMQDWKKR